MHIFLCILFLFALGGCGPEQTNRDAEDTELTILAQKQTRFIAERVGTYEGTMTQLDGTKTFKIRLILEPFNVLMPVANRAGYVLIPTMIGNLNTGSQGSGLSWSFSQGTYYESERALKMLGQSDGAPINCYLIIYYGEGKLRGKLVAGKLSSNLTLRKVE